jgi:hypothetical protein
MILPRPRNVWFTALLPLITLAPVYAVEEFDVVVYGGTSAGVIAAVQAKRMGKSVVLVSPDVHLGGLSSGGLGFTDSGDKSVIGGLAREFYHRIWQHYQTEQAWRWQQRAKFGNVGQGTPAMDSKDRTMWTFEPHVAEQVFEDLVHENSIDVRRHQWLDRENGVIKDEGRIVSIATSPGNGKEAGQGSTFKAKMFIDATYEGDLMAAAGVSYHVGREASQQYGEKWNGNQVGVLHHDHHFGILKHGIDPYVVPGDPQSGLLPRISADPPGEFGAGDHRVQAYCFRMCLTNVAENRVPFPRPTNYDPNEYALLVRIYETPWRGLSFHSAPVPNNKTDSNNFGPFGTDNIGFNYDYPDASYERRREIIAEHADFQQGLMYFLANDERVPTEVRAKVNEWGLAKDEFVDNDHWPHQLYIREARRMVGAFVMTENDLLKRRVTPQPIGMGSYTMDSHNVRRYVTKDGFVQNEGDVGVSTEGPYQIAYGSLVPKRDECENLLVPMCLSSSHIAYGSIRMEPVFMILGQSAATAAVQALEDGVAVQGVDYERLANRLRGDGQILSAAGQRD